VRDLDPDDPVVKKETGCISIHAHGPGAPWSEGVGEIDHDDAGATARDEKLGRGPQKRSARAAEIERRARRPARDAENVPLESVLGLRGRVARYLRLRSNARANGHRARKRNRETSLHRGSIWKKRDRAARVRDARSRSALKKLLPVPVHHEEVGAPARQTKPPEPTPPARCVPARDAGADQPSQQSSSAVRPNCAIAD
jgi:hypothetical protein